MNGRLPPLVARWLLDCVVPDGDRDAVVGDLIEEYSLRTQSYGSGAVTRWYWGQVCRSIPRLLWMSLRAEWTRALPIALAAYVAAAILEAAGTLALSKLFSLSATSAASVGVGLATMALAGYVAAWFRPSAAVLVAGLAFLVVSILMLTGSGNAPPWYALVFLIAGPLAALAGRTLSAMRRRADRAA